MNEVTAHAEESWELTIGDGSGNYIAEMASFVKTGAGGLFLSGYGYHTHSADMRILEGRVRTTRDGGGGLGRTDVMNVASSPFGNPQAEHTIYIGTNATYYSRYVNPFGGSHSTPKIKFVIDGKLEHFGDGNLQSAAATYGPLEFYSTNLVHSGRTRRNDDGVWRFFPNFTFNGDVTFGAAQPMTIPSQSGINTIAFGTGETIPVITVADATGDTQSDVIIGATIRDSLGEVPVKVNGAFSSWSYPSSPTRFIKAGEGTLDLGHGGSVFTGDVVVREGTLRLSGRGMTMAVKGSAMGNLTVPHTLTILDGATLDIQADYVFGSKYANSQLTVAVTNGTINFGSFRLINDDIKRDISYFANFGSLDLYDATLVHTAVGHSNGRADWGGTDGLFGISRRIAFDGTKPCVITNLGAYSAITLGYGLNTSIVTNFVDASTDTATVIHTNITYTGQVEFCVRDITGRMANGDGVTDVTIEPVLRQSVRAVAAGGHSVDLDATARAQANVRYFTSGLVKTGAGTLCLKAVNVYTGATDVVEGVLRVDGSILQSDITVQNGGMIGGTGSVSNLTVKAGGGFLIDYANAAEQLAVKGTWTLPEAGVLRVTGYEGALEKLRVPQALSIADAVNKDAVDVSQWTVLVDGHTATETKDMVVARSADILSVRYSPIGLMLIVR